jgi:glycosyltransferase involved in cell wall biosynthesis
MKPDISIIIPIYNSVATLTRAIESILKQDFMDWELFLVNDGSTDQSEEIARAFLIDSRISYLYQENKGVSAARNLGAANATGEWLIFLDSDDELTREALSNFSSYINSQPNKLSFKAGYCLVSSYSKVNYIPEKDQYSPNLSGTFCLNRKVFTEIAGYDERLHFSENTELFHRIELYGIEFSLIPKVSLIYHENVSGGSKNLQNMIDSLLIILDKHQNILSNHVKYLYHQIIGVNYMRFQNFPSARKHLLIAISYKPYKTGTIVRLGISLFPPLARKFYPKAVKL